MGLPISGDAAISNLDYSVLYDLSGATPSITLTNLSTVAIVGDLTWWFVITTPSGTFIHQGSLSTPDVTSATWTTWTIPANSWPLIFGTGSCAQVEFSPGSPYIVTVYVKSSATTNTYNLSYAATITRPNGNCNDSCGNFGQANVGVKVQCDAAKIYTYDRTNYAYGTILAPQSTTNTWTLVYPADATGNVPANGVATNVNYVYFPVGYMGDGYAIYLSVIATYGLPNNSSIKLQYKSNANNKVNTFGVWCGIDMCMFNFELQKLLALTKQKPGQLDNSELETKLIRATSFFTLLLQVIVQPLCNIDVPKLRRELEKELGLEEGCSCNPIGVNPGNSSGSTPPPAGCCSLDDTLGVGNITSREARFISAGNILNVTNSGLSGVLNTGDQNFELNAQNLRLSNDALGTQYSLLEWNILSMIDPGVGNSSMEPTAFSLLDATTLIKAILQSNGLTLSNNHPTDTQLSTFLWNLWTIADPAVGTLNLGHLQLNMTDLSGNQTIYDPGSFQYTPSGGHAMSIEFYQPITADRVIQNPDDSGTIELARGGFFTAASGSTTYNIPHSLGYTPIGANIWALDDGTGQNLAVGWYLSFTGTDIVVHLHTSASAGMNLGWRAYKYNT